MTPLELWGTYSREDNKNYSFLYLFKYKHFSKKDSNKVIDLMFIPCIIRYIRKDQRYTLIVPLLYSTYWLLRVSTVTCHHQGAY
jgi:hypothetical protein